MSREKQVSDRGASTARIDTQSEDVRLRVENLRKTFGDEVAVDDLSLEVQDAHLKSLLGPSGCGKTTTLRCIAGLERPDSGKIWIGDELVCDPANDVHVEPENRGIGMVFQSYAVWPHMTVKENVMYPLKIQKIGTKQEREQKVARVLDAVGLEPYKDNLSTNLSGGQQQRVAISRALVVEPDILLFDEPLSNLDAKLRREMRLEINRIYHEFETTVLYVTHAQDEAMFLSDEIALMRDGQIVEEGNPATLHSNPKTFFGMNFMGQCNTVEGTVLDMDDDSITVDTDIGDVTSTSFFGDLQAGEEVFTCFRPKHCRLLIAEAATPGEDELVFEGTVVMRAATRDFTEYQIDIEGTEVLVRTPEPLSVDEGEAVRFAVETADVRVFPFSENRKEIVEDAVADAEDEDVDTDANDGAMFGTAATE